MPKHAKPRAAHPAPIYRMEVWPDLFGRAALLRQWGRTGTEGRRRSDPHPDGHQCTRRLVVRKRRRVYQDQGT